MDGLSGKKISISAVSLLFLLLMSETVIAVPACPGGAKVMQPDGTAITIFLKGDEHAHWNESEDGYLITKNKTSKEWVYITEKAGAAAVGRYVVGKADPVAIGASRPSKSRSSTTINFSRTEISTTAPLPDFTLLTGTMYNLVVLVNFSDLAVAYSQQSYDDLFNEIGYTDDGAAGSVKDYYHEISYNALTVQSTVVEAVTLDYGYAYYGANDAYGYDVRPQEMVEQALAKLEARGFDFNTVDGDSDGWVDGLTIIHAGGGEEYSGNDEDYIWSHQWALNSAVTYDGVSMQIYHTEPARRGWDGYPSTYGITRIGVICHENGHFLGLPDLYDYDYDSEGAGGFCLMAGGSWNGDNGTSPAHMSAWCKSSLGWVSPTVISSDGAYSLGRVETNSQVFKLQGEFSSNEYFLVENRQGVGFDSGLPGSQRGILIWHVDESQPNNNDQTHYKVDLEEASGTQHLELNQNAGEDSDYFRAGNATMFTDSTTPNNLSYSSQALGINITNVGTTGASMTVTFGVTPSISSITPNSGASGTIVNITDLAGNAFQNGADVRLTQAGEADIVASNVTVVNATKITCTFSLAGAATGGWDVMVTNPDAQWAVLTDGFNVTEQGTTVLLSEGFESSFVSGAPAGWSKSFQSGTLDWIRNSGDSRNNGSYEGDYNALLYEGSYTYPATYLITPAINFPSGTQEATLKFRHKQADWWGDQDTLTVYYKTSSGGSWVQLASYITDVADWTQRTISLPNTSEDYYIGFLGSARYGYGVCIDDVNVTGIIPQLQTLTISSTSGGHTDPNEGDHQFSNGAVVDINAIPYPGYQFANWTGSGVTAGKVANPNSASTTITMDDDYSANANFTVDQKTIFGYITEFDPNIPVEGVFINATNGGGSDTTDPNGYYQLTVDYGWSGTVDPNKRGYTFDPNNKEYNNVTVDQNNDYIAILDTFIISGYAVDSEMLTPLEGVLVSPDNDGGPFTSKYYGGSDTTDPNGFYEVWVDYNWSGKVVPSKYAYVFDPNSRSYANVTEDKEESQDYIGRLLTYTITGIIENSCGVPIGGVLVDANNGSGSDITDPNGFYEVWVDHDWPGTVTPMKEHYTFDPNRISYSDILEDQTGGDYTATNIYDLDCDGAIGFGDLSVMCQNWLETGPDVPGDFYKDDDDIVNFPDFAEFALIWQEQ